MKNEDQILCALIHIHLKISFALEKPAEMQRYSIVLILNKESK